MSTQCYLFVLSRLKPWMSYHCLLLAHHQTYTNDDGVAVSLLTRVTSDDGEEDAVRVQAHSPRQLAGAPSVLHRRPAAGADRPAGVPVLLRLSSRAERPTRGVGDD